MLGQKLNAVAAGHSIERVGRVVNLEAFWFADDLFVFANTLRRKILFLALLEKDKGWAGVRDILARINPGVLLHESVVSFRPDFQAMFLLFL